MLKVFIENLSERNEGNLIGRWFDLEDYDGYDDMREQGCFKLIGVADGTDCEEWIVTDYNTDVPIDFSEHPNLDSFANRRPFGRICGFRAVSNRLVIKRQGVKGNLKGP